MTVLKRSIFFLALVSAITIVAQGTKKPIPASTAVDKASDVIDAVITTKDTVQPVKREEPPKTTTTTTTTSTTSSTPASSTSSTPASSSTTVKPAPTTTYTTPATTSSSSTTSTTTTTSTSSTTSPASTAPATTSVPATTTWTPGSTASSAPIQANSKSAIYVSSKTTFELISQDDLSLVDFVEYKVNDSEYVKYTGPVSIGKEGPATITYRAVDKVGNKENAQVLNIIVDNTPPVASLKPVEPLYLEKANQYASTKNTYVINAEDSSSGVKEIFYTIDNEPKQKFAGQPIKLEKPGFHVINYYAVDNAGNVSPEQTFLVNVDGTKPTVDILESIPYVKVNEKTFARKDTTFKVAAKDAESGIAKILVKVDNSPEFVPYVEDLAFTTSGEHSIEAKAIDNVGNESDVKKVTFLYDVKAPQTSIKAVTGN
ncbi:MAG: hypothetical protein SFU98_14800 [Leptospiraceae bacterium]|nr:hypothetical protein [Leptospiraceae bacterium]